MEGMMAVIPAPEVMDRINRQFAPYKKIVQVQEREFAVVDRYGNILESDVSLEEIAQDCKVLTLGETIRPGRLRIT